MHDVVSTHVRVAFDGLGLVQLECSRMRWLVTTVNGALPTGSLASCNGETIFAGNDWI